MITKVESKKYKVIVRIRISKKIVQKIEYSNSKENAKILYEKIKTDLRSKNKNKFSTISDVLDFYIENKQLGKSLSVINTVKNAIGIESVENAYCALSDFIEQIKLSKTKKTKKNFSNATINRYISWSIAAFNFSKNAKKIQENYLHGFKMLKELPRNRILTDQEKIRLFNSLHHIAPELEPIIQYAIIVPSRISELLNLKKESYNMIGRYINIQASDTKNKIETYKPVPQNMYEYFDNLPNTATHLFYSKDMNKIKNFTSTWLKILKDANIIDFKFHDFRHEAATKLINNGTPEEVVAQIAGWKSTKMLKTYYHRNTSNNLKYVKFSPENLNYNNVVNI